MIKQYGRYTVETERDTDPMNPRDNDNLGEMICFHSRYILGDKHTYSEDEALEMQYDDKYIALPLYLYDHSGITMNTTGFSCSWDSGKVGIIAVHRDKILEEYGYRRITKKLREKVLAILKAEVDEYDQYLRGDVYGVIVKDENGNVIESCWGFYDEELAMSDGIDMAQFMTKKDIKIKAKKTKAFILHNVPLEKRV